MTHSRHARGHTCPAQLCESGSSDLKNWQQEPGHANLGPCLDCKIGKQLLALHLRVKGLLL